MSRIVTIRSELVAEVDLAEEVVKELKANSGILARSLTYNKRNKCFQSLVQEENDDALIRLAEKLYYAKRRERNIKKVDMALKKSKYRTKIKVENNKTKIVAVQRVYA